MEVLASKPEKLHRVDQLQGDQLNMAMFLGYLSKIDLSSVRHCTRVHWTSHFLKGTSKTMFIGHLVYQNGNLGRGQELTKFASILKLPDFFQICNVYILWLQISIWYIYISTLTGAVRKSKQKVTFPPGLSYCCGDSAYWTPRTRWTRSRTGQIRSRA